MVEKQVRRNQQVVARAETEAERVAADVGAAAVAAGERGRVVVPAGRHARVVGAVVGLEEFLIPGVAFQIFPAVGKVPLTFLGGFAERHADGAGLILAIFQGTLLALNNLGCRTQSLDYMVGTSLVGERFLIPTISAAVLCLIWD